MRPTGGSANTPALCGKEQLPSRILVVAYVVAMAVYRRKVS